MSVIIKVGATMQLNLINVQAIPAFTFEDLELAVQHNQGIKLAIIEGMTDGEISAAAQAVDKVKQSGVEVIFYTAGEYSEDARQAIENLGDRHFDSETKLQEYLSSKLGVNAVTEFGAGVSTSSDKQSGTVEEPTVTWTGRREGDAGSREDIPAEQEEPGATPAEPKDTPTEPGETSQHIPDVLGVDSELLSTLERGHDEQSDTRNESQADLADLLSRTIRERDSLQEQLKAAGERLQVASEVQMGLQSELATCKRLLSGFAMGVEMDPGEYGPDHYKDLADQFNALTDRRKSLEKDVAAAQAVIDQQEETIESLQASVEALAAEKAALSDEKATLLNDAYEQRKARETIEEELLGIRAQLEELQAEHERYNEDTFSELQANLKEVGAKVGELAEQLVKAQDKLREQEASLADKEAAYQDEVQASQEKSQRISELEAEVANLTSTVESSREEIQQLEGKLAEASQEAEVAKSNLSLEYEQKAAEMQGDNTKLSELTKQMAEAQKRCEGELAAAEEELAKLKAELAEARAGAGATEERAHEQAIEPVAQRTQSTEEVDTLRSEVAQLRNTNEQLSAQVTSQSETIKRLRETAQTQAPAPATKSISIDYTGKASIVTVFGSGSYGVTTVAMTMAMGLPEKSVLYLDFNAANPKGDAWFAKQPLVPQLTDIAEPIMRSAFGALITKGTQYVIDRRHELITRAIEAGRTHGPVDYFSGVYGKVDLDVLRRVDFTALFNWLGELYDYIVVDLGALGGSGVCGELVQELCRISYKWAVVTLNDMFDVRNINVKMPADKFDRRKATWVLNMAETTAVDPMIRKAIGAAIPMIIPRDLRQIGSRKSLWANQVLKEHAKKLMWYAAE